MTLACMFSLQDNPIGKGTGVYKNRRLFEAPKGHASLVPMDGLVKLGTRAEPSSGSHQSEPSKWSACHSLLVGLYAGICWLTFATNIGPMKSVWFHAAAILGWSWFPSKLFSVFRAFIALNFHSLITTHNKHSTWQSYRSLTLIFSILKLKRNYNDSFWSTIGHLALRICMVDGITSPAVRLSFHNDQVNS